MLVIRLFRVGKKNQPFFKIVVIDKRKATNKGRFVEEVGFLNPLTKEKILKKERIEYWLSVGAKPSETLHNLLVKEGIVEGKKISKHKKAKKKETGETPAPSAEAGGTEQVKEDAKPEVKEKKEEAVSEEKPKEKEKPVKEPEAPKEEKKEVEEVKEEKPSVPEKPVEEPKKVDAPEEAPQVEAPEEPKEIEAPESPSGESSQDSAEKEVSEKDEASEKEES
jgi:small subunit ribosomal protein S16